MKTLLICLALSLPAQDGVDDLIQKLRSEKIEERDAAAKKLAELGEAARPALQALRKDPDRDLSARAAAILVEIGAREKTRRFLVPARTSTATVRSLTLEDAAAKVFAPFGLAARIRGGDGYDAGITVVSLDVKDAPFWGAVDQFCTGTRVFHNGIGLAGPQAQELAFQNGAWPVAWDTLGDVRVFGMILGGRNPGLLVPHFWIACPPWAVPDRVRFERLNLIGWPGTPELGAQAADDGPIPRAAGRMTVAPLPADVKPGARDAFKDVESVDVEGVLRFTSGDEKGKDDVLVPFAIRGIPLPRR